MFSVYKELKLKGYENKSLRPTIHIMVKMYKDFKLVVVCRMYKVLSYRVEISRKISKQTDINELQVAFNRVKEDVEDLDKKNEKKKVIL